MRTIAREVGRTVRAALVGWPHTARLVIIACVLTACVAVLINAS